MNESLRATVAADLAPVLPLRPPSARALLVLPLALVLLVAAPLVFEFRDLRALGPWWSWGASIAQVVAGLALIAAALRDAVPGRAWRVPALALWLLAPLAAMVIVTQASWTRDPVVLTASWWWIGVICIACAFVSALPVVVLGGLLTSRAYPTRPRVTGALIGLGAGLMADAGWRLFCHYSEPAHVLSAHLGAVILLACAAAIGQRAHRRP